MLNRTCNSNSEKIAAARATVCVLGFRYTIGLQGRGRRMGSIAYSCRDYVGYGYPVPSSRAEGAFREHGGKYESQL